MAVRISIRWLMTELAVTLTASEIIGIHSKDFAIFKIDLKNYNMLSNYHREELCPLRMDLSYRLINKVRFYRISFWVFQCA